MRTIPTASELLEIIAHYLRRTLADKLEPPHRYDVLVAANSLDIVRREIELGPAADEAAKRRIEELLGIQGSLAEIESALIAAIAEQRIAIDSPPLLDHLLKTTLDEAAIDQPRYATYKLMLRSAKKREALPQ